MSLTPDDVIVPPVISTSPIMRVIFDVSRDPKRLPRITISVSGASKVVGDIDVMIGVALIENVIGSEVASCCSWSLYDES